MKYCLYYKDGKKLFRDAFFNFYSKDDPVGLAILKKIRIDNKTVSPFISSKEDCNKTKKIIYKWDPYLGIEPIDWKIASTLYGKFLSFYNSIFNFILNRKLGF